MKIETRKETEGEEIIRMFLEDEAIEFKQEVEIPGLTGDFADFRIADFYLPQYKVYVEFLGQWNAGERHRERYKLKKDVYRENNIPCVYLYPENLGILKMIFKRRLKEQLTKRPELKLQLVKLNWRIFTEKFGFVGIILAFLVYYVPNFYWKGGLLIMLIAQIYSSIKESFLKRV